MITTVNPTTGLVLANYEELSSEQIQSKLEEANSAFLDWRKTEVAVRSEKFLKLAEILDSKKSEIAKLMALEMGKPVAEGITEVEKCISCVKYYAENIEKILENEAYQTSFTESYVSFEPMGIILAIMPWNFPFWQALRAAIPTILAGNVLVLKHASNVQDSAKMLEEIFNEAGFEKGIFTNLCISSKEVEGIIRNPLVKGVTLTGSEKVGSIVASTAGSEIKKTVMELGGSDAFIVLADANIEEAVQAAYKSRLRNAGQSCTAAKRFIVVKDVAEEFTAKLKKLFEETKVGDPLLPETNMGPLSSQNALEGIEDQVKKSVEAGAKVIIGGKRIEGEGFFYEPTILSEVKAGMPAYDEEVFGPVAAIITVSDENEAIRVANDHRYGLSSSLWTNDIQKAKELAKQIEAGGVFVNSLSTSQIEMPFGGIKKSGYGRELSGYGVKEFLNIKSVLIRE